MSSGVRVPIAVKLVLVTVALIICVVVPVAIRNSQLFESTFSKSQRDANAELSNSKAIEVEGLLFNYVDKVRTVTNLVIAQDSAPKSDPAMSGARADAGIAQFKDLLDLVFFHDLDLVNIDIYQLKNGVPVLFKRETNESYLKKFELKKSYISRLRNEKSFTAEVFTDGEKIVVRNTTLTGGIPLFSIGVPFSDAGGSITHVAIADIRLDRLQKAFSLKGVRTLYLIDERGSVLAHCQDQFALEDRSLAHLPIVKDSMARGEASTKGQRRFFDPDLKEWFIGAYSRTSFGPTVFSQAPEKIILEPAQLARTEAFEVAGYVFSAALFFVILFSLTLTSPIESLHEATEQVTLGNLDVKAIVTTQDEVGQLARSFNFMLAGIRERDKVKNILMKFHGSSITEDLLKNDLKLGGTRKQVTVFFSDIRDFTKFSEEHTPEQVVEMLNEYFQIMVSVITRNHGIVDKFVGDAVMAVWGAPQTTGQDSLNAVKATLEMRTAIGDLNYKRIKRGQPAIKIGMGLHSGPAISGKIGSTERMEYTVIGDTVNMASRIEASTKAFGADILISETVANEVKEQILIEFAGDAEVKGKAEPIKMFKVRGTISSTGETSIVETPYSDFAPADADKVKISA